MRNINELIGIINGINYDGIINQLEVAKLSSWVKKNRNLSYEPNQAYLISLVDQVLEDGVITDDERKELINYCSQYTDQESDSFAKIYELNGIIEGIICDNVINEKEIYHLREWMDQNASIVKGHKSSKMIYETISQILEDNIVTLEEQESLLNMLSKIIIDTQLENKIEYLRNRVKARKNIGIDLIDLLDNPDAIDVINGRAERELAKTLNTYFGTYVQDPEIIFISLVLIGMLHYDGTFYEYVRETYKYLYQQFSEQKIEGLIRTILNGYRTKEEINQSKTRIINVVLAGSIVPSHFLGSFFEFIYDIYKLNFESVLPQDLHEEFQFVYDGLQNVMESDGDEIQVKVTRKTYKLIKSTKQLIINPIYNDAVINLSIIVVRLIDKYIWGEEVSLYNPYLKRGYEQWLASLKNEKKERKQKKKDQFRSHWEPKYVLNGNTVSLIPPIHRVKSIYNYNDIHVVVKNGDEIIYKEKVTDIREIIGGYQVKSDPIKLSNPLGNITYQLLAGRTVIYNSKTKLYRNFLVFDKQGGELNNNKDYSGTSIICTKASTERFHSYFDSEKYHLSYYNAHIGDTIYIDNAIFNFSEMIRPGIFGEKHERCFISLENSKIEVFKKDVILIYESECFVGNFEIQINHRTHKIQEFDYSITERTGVNKYTVKLHGLKSGIYEINVSALKSGKRTGIMQTRFAIDKNLQFKELEEDGETYIVSVTSDLIKQSVVEEIDVRNFKEDWLKFEWNGITYTYYIPLCFNLYRIDGSEWMPFSEEIWIGNITQSSVIDIYGKKFDSMCLLTSTGKTIEDVPGIKDEDVFYRLPAGFLLSYKTSYDYISILFLINGRFNDGIICYNKCILDESKTFLNYSLEEKALIVTPYFYGKGNIRFRVVDSSNNIVYTSSYLTREQQEYVYGLKSFINYKVVFFEKEKGLSLKKEHLLKGFQTIFYDRKDFEGRSFKIAVVYFDQYIKGELLRKKYRFNTTYVYFKKMLNGNEYVGEIYVRTQNKTFMLNRINPVNIEICSDVIDGSIELSITKDGDGLLLDFDHHGIMNSMDDARAVDIYSYSINMKELNQSE